MEMKLQPTDTWSDAALHRALRKMFEEEHFRDCPLPVLEDLANEPEFRAWREAVHGITGGRQLLQCAYHSGWLSLATGRQRGGSGSKHELPPVVGVGLSPHEHFQASAGKAEQKRDPWALGAAVDFDMTFAARQVIGRIADPRQSHKRLKGLIRELSRRCQPVTVHLRRAQPRHVHLVAGKLHLFMVAVCCLFMLWKDYRMPGRLIKGFQVIEKLEESGLWRLAEFPEPILAEDLFAACTANKAWERNRPMAEKAASLWASVAKVKSKRVGEAPVSEQVMDARYGKDAYAATPCFIHTQPDGKERRIDNGKQGKTNPATQYTERFSMNSAFTPAFCAQALWRTAIELDAPGWVFDAIVRLETGGEDVPDAF